MGEGWKKQRKISLKMFEWHQFEKRPECHTKGKRHNFFQYVLLEIFKTENNHSKKYESLENMNLSPDMVNHCWHWLDFMIIKFSKQKLWTHVNFLFIN